MDFVRLGPRYSNTYIPDQLIEGYNSLIWTERFQSPGEFILKTFDIDGVKALLPEDTLVSHLDTREVMMVETHSIEEIGEGADARPELTVTGRSATSILEHRWVEATYQTKRRMRYAYSATSALCVLLVQAVDNISGKDITRGDTTASTPEVNDYNWTTLDSIPNTVVTESVASEGAARWWLLEEGMLLPQFQKIMVDADLGLRILRPATPNPGTVITVYAALANRGTIVRTYTPDITELRFDIYSGVDRTATVQLSQLQGHIDNPTYLTSSRGYKSVVEIASGVIEVSDVYRPGESGLTGWQRRTIGMDGGTPEIPAAPEKPEDLGRNPTAAQREAYYDAIDAWKLQMAAWNTKRNTIITNFRAEQTAAAQRILKEQRRLDMFAGDVSTLSPYQYKTHYDLGDTIMLFGDYGKVAPMIVSEYVRTEDANGDRGFPGLVAP